MFLRKKGQIHTLVITRVSLEEGKKVGRGHGGDREGGVFGKWLGWVASEKNSGKRELSFMRQSSGQEPEKGIS